MGLAALQAFGAFKQNGFLGDGGFGPLEVISLSNYSYIIYEML